MLSTVLHLELETARIERVNEMLKSIEKEIRGIESKNEFIARIEEMLLLCGVERFSYVYVPLSLSEVSEVYIFGNYDKSWVDFYKEERFYRKDPVMLETSKSSLPFFWNKVSDKIKKDSRVFDLAHNYGIEKGYSIPVHEPGSGFGSIHIPAELSDINFENRIKKSICALRFLSVMAHHYLSEEAMADCHISFSKREEECLYWVSQGKTYIETAMIMGITERTVKFHIKSMSNKLNVVNSKQLIVKAMAMNLLPVSFK